jgi:bacteriocin-like protein
VENAEQDKELTEEELDQTSGGSWSWGTPTPPTVSPGLNFGIKGEGN